MAGREGATTVQRCHEGWEGAAGRALGHGAGTTRCRQQERGAVPGSLPIKCCACSEQAEPGPPHLAGMG